MRKIVCLLLLTISIYESYSLGISSTNWSKPLSLPALNSPADDYAPQWNEYENLLYFNSERTGYAMFYTAQYNNNEFTKIQLIKSPINKSRNNQNYISFLSAENAYLTTFKKTENYPVLSIFRSIYIKNGWSEPIYDDTLNIGNVNSQLTISPDKSTAVFVSNKNNKSKDTDLWMIQRNEDGWSEPVLLDELNSDGREITPFLKSNDTLYFSSDGLGGPGGFDLYISVRLYGKWQRPIPLFDFNTEFDESDLIILQDGTALFSSNMPGGAGGLDFYYSKPAENESLTNFEENPELYLQVQVDAVNINLDIKSAIFPFQGIVPSGIFTGNKSQHPFDEFMINSISIISERMILFSSAELYISNSKYNSKILEIFKTNGIDSGRIKFQGKEDTDFITLQSNDERLFTIYEHENRKYELKPPVLDINLSIRNSVKLQNISGYFQIDNKVTQIDLPKDTLPLRFYYPLESFASKLYSADSLKITFKLTYSNGNDDSVTKKIMIYKSQNKSKVQTSESKKFVDFYLLVRDKNDLANFLKNQKDYIDIINDEISISKGVSIQFVKSINNQTAQDLQSNLKNKNIKFDFGLIEDKTLISLPYSEKIVRIRVNKY